MRPGSAAASVAPVSTLKSLSVIDRIRPLKATVPADPTAPPSGGRTVKRASSASVKGRVASRVRNASPSSAPTRDSTSAAGLVAVSTTPVWAEK